MYRQLWFCFVSYGAYHNPITGLKDSPRTRHRRRFLQYLARTRAVHPRLYSPAVCLQLPTTKRQPPLLLQHPHPSISLLQINSRQPQQTHNEATAGWYRRSSRPYISMNSKKLNLTVSMQFFTRRALQIYAVMWNMTASRVTVFDSIESFSWVSTREYFMHYRGPGFLAVIWFGSFPSPHW